MVTLKEIAEACHVSAATVSNIINGKSKASAETTQYVLDTIEKMGYRPNFMARGLRRQKTKIIALVVDDIAQFTTPPIIESIMEYCEEVGYHVVMWNLRLYSRWADTWYNQETEYHSIVDPVLDDVLSAQVEGVIYVAGHARIVRCFRKDFPIPAVMAYAFSDMTEIPSIVLSDAESACEVNKYLLSKGHKKIGFIGGRVDNHHTQQRLQGYQKALFEYGILYNPDLVYYAEWTRETGYKGAKALIEKGVTALFCVSDKMAVGVYDYAEEAGLVIGKDISVAGYDSEEWSDCLNPKLTTTKLPLDKIGRSAAKLLIDRLENGENSDWNFEEPEVIRIPCTFIERNSVGRIDS